MFLISLAAFSSFSPTQKKNISFFLNKITDTAVLHPKRLRNLRESLRSSQGVIQENRTLKIHLIFQFAFIIFQWQKTLSVQFINVSSDHSQYRVDKSSSNYLCLSINATLHNICTHNTTSHNISRI